MEKHDEEQEEEDDDDDCVLTLTQHRLSSAVMGSELAYGVSGNGQPHLPPCSICSRGKERKSCVSCLSCHLQGLGTMQPLFQCRWSDSYNLHWCRCSV